MPVVSSLLGSQLDDIAGFIKKLNEAYEPDADVPYGVKDFQWGDGFRAVIPLGTRIPIKSDGDGLLGYIVLGDFSWEFTMKEATNG